MKFTRLPRLRGLAMTACAVLAASAATAACTLKRVAELPVTMSDLRPTVPAKIDGRSVRLLADTGAFFSMISPGLATEMKLQTHAAPFELYVSGVGGAMKTSVTSVKTLELDAISLSHVDFIVGGSGLGAGIDGLVGRNLLTGFDGEYDLANGVIRFMKPADCFGRSLAYWPSPTPASSVGIVLNDNVNDNRPPIVVLVTVNGQTLKATLDTGASTTVIWRSAAQRVGIPVEGLSAPEAGLSGGVGKRLVHQIVAPVRSFKIGDEEIKNTRISVIDTALEGSDMLLGADFFLAHRIYIAGSQHRVFFTYNGGPVFNLTAKRLDIAATSTPAGAITLDAAKSEPSAPGEPSDAAGFSRRGAEFAGRRDYPKAAADFDRAVVLAPDNADYVYQRAELRLANGQVFLAMNDIQQTLKLRPGDPEALLTRAQLFAMGHDRSAALTDLDAVAKSLSETADLRLRLAGLYETADEDPEAIAQYDLWIAAHPEDSRRGIALNGRCWRRALLNAALDKALADCNAAVRSDPKGPGFMDSRGLVFLRLGQFDRSIADYNAALVLRPKSAWSLYGRGLAKLKAGDAEGGKSDIDAATAASLAVVAEAAKYGLKP